MRTLTHPILKQRCVEDDRASLVAQMVKNPPAKQETSVQSLGREDPLEEGMATHSSALAWSIPMERGAGGLQSMESQRVRHDWAPKHSTEGDNQSHYIRICVNVSSIITGVIGFGFSMAALAEALSLALKGTPVLCPSFKRKGMDIIFLVWLIAGSTQFWYKR